MVVFSIVCILVNDSIFGSLMWTLFHCDFHKGSKLAIRKKQSKLAYDRKLYISKLLKQSWHKVIRLIKHNKFNNKYNMAWYKIVQHLIKRFFVRNMQICFWHPQSMPFVKYVTFYKDNLLFSDRLCSFLKTATHFFSEITMFK